MKTDLILLILGGGAVAYFATRKSATPQAVPDTTPSKTPTLDSIPSILRNTIIGGGGGSAKSKSGISGSVGEVSLNLKEFWKKYFGGNSTPDNPHTSGPINFDSAGAILDLQTTPTNQGFDSNPNPGFDNGLNNFDGLTNWDSLGVDSFGNNNNFVA